MVVCLAREDLYFGALWWERKVISAGEMAGGRVSFSDTTGTCPKSGCSSEKNSLRGVHPSDFSSRQGENERRPISCAHSSWIKRSTLLCRKMTRVHPVVTFLFCYGSSNGYKEHINIGSSAPDWPGTVQKHADTSTMLKKTGLSVDQYKKGVNTGVFASKYNSGINNLRCETAAFPIATSSKRKSP